MLRTDLFKRILKFSFGVMILELIVLTIVFLICWQTGWIRFQQIGIVLVLAGGFLLLFGFLGFQGDWEVSNKYSDKIGSVRSNTPFIKNFFDLTRGEGYIHGMFAVGILNVFAGFALTF